MSADPNLDALADLIDRYVDEADANVAGLADVLVERLEYQSDGFVVPNLLSLANVYSHGGNMPAGGDLRTALVKIGAFALAELERIDGVIEQAPGVAEAGE